MERQQVKWLLVTGILSYRSAVVVVVVVVFSNKKGRRTAWSQVIRNYLFISGRLCISSGNYGEICSHRNGWGSKLVSPFTQQLLFAKKKSEGWAIKMEFRQVQEQFGPKVTGELAGVKWCVYPSNTIKKLVYSKAAHENHNFTRVTRLTCLSQKAHPRGRPPLKKSLYLIWVRTLAPWQSWGIQELSFGLLILQR